MPTPIQWTDETWNCVRGCSRVSTGCGDSDGGGCYAEHQAYRFSGAGSHKWCMTIEHYPTYAWNRWTCKTCRVFENFPDSKSPIPVKLEICNMGHVHTVEAVTEETWPEVIYYRNEG